MSKGLEALKELLEILDYYKDKAQRNFQTIRIFSELPNYIEEIEKELKALKIIKEKNINVSRLYGCMVAYPYEKTPIHYNEEIDKRYKRYMLVQEEFDLLKEILE